MTTKLWSLTDVARLLGVSTTTLSNWRARNIWTFEYAYTSQEGVGGLYTDETVAEIVEWHNGRKELTKPRQDLYSMSEAAKYLGMTEVELHEMIDAGMPAPGLQHNGEWFYTYVKMRKADRWYDNNVGN